MLLNERSQPEMATNRMTFWKRQNCGDNKNINGCQGEGMNRQNTEDF